MGALVPADDLPDSFAPVQQQNVATANLVPANDIPDHLQPPKPAANIWEDIQAGYQGSATGLAVRGKLPDVVLDSQNAKWYDKLLSGASQVVSEIPESVAGFVGGSAAGAAAGGAVGSAIPVAGTVAGAATGAVLGAGAGAFAVPTAIRESLIQAYTKGQVTSSADFLDRAKIVLGETGKAALIGAFTGGAGAIGGRVVGSALAPLAGDIGVNAVTTGIGAANLATSTGAMVTANAALQGKLPEPEDFMNAAILVGGLHVASVVAPRIANIYAATGIPPEQVVADAKTDPAIAESLTNPSLNADPHLTVDAVSRAIELEGFDDFQQRVQHAIDQIPENERTSTTESSVTEAEARLVVYNQGVNGEIGSKAWNDLEIQKEQALQNGADGKPISQDALNEQHQAAAESQLPEPYKPLEAQQNAIQALKIQSPDSAQQFVESPFGEVPQEPGQPKVKLYPNFDYINTSDDAAAVLARATELYGSKVLEQTRGTVSWQDTEADGAQKLAEMIGAKDPSLLINRQPGTGAGATEIYLRGQLMQGAVEDFTNKAKAYDPLTSSPEDAVNMQAAAERVAMLSSYFQGASSETGRALNAVKMLKSGLRQADAIQKLMEGSPDPATVANIMKDVNDPVGAAAVARSIFEPEALSTLGKIGQVWKAGMLSGTKTYMVKAIGDSVGLATNVVERAIAAGIGTLHGGDKVSPNEVAGLVTGISSGVQDALAMGVSTWKSQGVPQDANNAWGYKPVFGVSDGETPEQGSAADIANKVIAIPHRIMGAETEFFKTLNSSGELRYLAVKQANSENLTPNTDAFNSRVADIISNPSPEMSQAAKDAGDNFTFTNRTGEFGQILNKISQNDLGQFVVPFSTVPANLVNFALQRIPGIANLMDSVQEEFAAGGSRRDIAIAKQVVGAGVITAAGIAVKNGILTGGGLSLTPQQRIAQQETRQDYSIKLGGTWYSYNRFDPIARIMSLAADSMEMYQAYQSDETASLPSTVALMFGHALISQPYLEGLHSFMDALSDPTNEGKRYFDTFIGSWVPAFLGQTASATDANTRRIDDWADAIQSKIPVLREQLLPKIDPLTGKPLPNNSNMTPVNALDPSKDLVLTEAARLNVGISRSPTGIEIPKIVDKKLGKVQLTPEQQNTFDSESGNFVHQTMTNLINSPNWDTLGDLRQKLTFQKVIEAGRTIGRSKALTPEEWQADAQAASAKLQQELNN